MTEPLDPDILERLERFVGLTRPDASEPLHVELVRTLRRVKGMPDGVQLAALRFVFNWELHTIGKEFVTAKSNYEHYLDKEKMKFMVEKNFSATKATTYANATDEAYTLLLKYRLAEQRAQSMRKFLDTLNVAVEVWRSVNANERRADFAHAKDGV